jgi:hypothetical protein
VKAFGYNSLTNKEKEQAVVDRAAAMWYISHALQDAGSCGAFHRSSPTGGAAKGIPLKILMLPSCVPSIFPYFVCTILN